MTYVYLIRTLGGARTGSPSYPCAGDTGIDP